MTFADSLTRIRRLLRDPDGNVHTDAQLRRYWDQAQLEIAQKTGILERAETYRYPGRFHTTYTHDWEAGFAEGDYLQVLLGWPAQDMQISYPWEANYLATTAPGADEGDRCTQPWEYTHGTLTDPVPVQLHARIDRMRFAAYDDEELRPLAEREVCDPYRRTRTGTPEGYYMLDEPRRLVALYPQPSITYDEVGVGDVFDDTGGIVSWLDSLTENQDTGIVIESIETAGNLFMVYQALPTTGLDDDEAHDWPAYLVHYVECAVLERGYGADTDGFVPSLRDYWRQRKELGIAAVKRFRAQRTKARAASMGPGRRSERMSYPQLPSHYPEA